MAEITISYKELKSLRPCDEGLLSVQHLFAPRKRVSAAEAAAAGAKLSELVWVASGLATTRVDVATRLRLWSADCAARVLPIFEEERPADKRVREAIIATRAFARGIGTKESLAAAGDGARRAALVAHYFRSDFAAMAACCSTLSARMVVYAAGDAATAAGDDRNIRTEEQWQIERFCAWFSANEPEDWPLASEQESG